MANLLLLVCVLAVLIHQGHCLSCTSCANNTGLTCTGPQQTCVTEDVCFSVMNYYPERKSTNVFTGCGPFEYCDSSYTIFSGNEKADSWIRCCQEDNCTPPANYLIENGLLCPASNVTGNYSQCKGDQNKCFIIPGSDTTSYGCGNDKFCLLSFGNMSDNCKDTIATTTSPPPTTTTRPASTTLTTEVVCAAAHAIYSPFLLFLLGLFAVNVSVK
ncbi:phospholipase A2 inhibitor and Ly6/PLAUR domain-containing protein-like [Engystomops pustulosus]|uniref:phospholipase A2 inhibitor and Ly6/PLAUR domain-containing protein-like n=1 Tax=Engystomops pustulosus TaxID=76066 RepID=UPI003AFA7EB6